MNAVLTAEIIEANLSAAALQVVPVAASASPVTLMNPMTNSYDFEAHEAVRLKGIGITCPAAEVYKPGPFKITGAASGLASYEFPNLGSNAGNGAIYIPVANTVIPLDVVLNITGASSGLQWWLQVELTDAMWLYYPDKTQAMYNISKITFFAIVQFNESMITHS